MNIKIITMGNTMGYPTADLYEYRSKEDVRAFPSDMLKILSQGEVVVDIVRDGVSLKEDTRNCSEDEQDFNFSWKEVIFAELEKLQCLCFT